ncbi:tetratricopeptide repeat-containing glycosyltransferase family protein [Yoonia sp. 208BN28-4]|uniref:tetratricopeptide repeat-containing glycosyltransferase family protein n=1 Tax=Yoonia sp. 208BN28-4 TaxID=3126505 RepID=UPI0030B38FE2
MQPSLKDLRATALRLQQAGKLTEALPAYSGYLNAAPRDATMWSNLGALHRAAGRHRQALRAHRRAVAIAPDIVSYKNNLANVLSDIGRYDESIAVRQDILSTNPDDLNHKAMIGRCLRGKGDYHAAIDYLQAAIADHPEDTELRMQLSFAQLGAGDYATAFETYRVRWEAGELKPRDVPFPEWTGEPLDGKTVLVMPEQGFGDAVLFSRFVKTLKTTGATVLVMAEKPLLQLFEGLEGADWVGLQLSKSAPVDFWINMMDLAALHFADSNDVPVPTKLTIPDASRDRARAIIKPYPDVFKIGVIWTGSATYKGNAFRSFSHTDFLPLTDIAGVQLFSLYKGPFLDAFEADGSSAFMVDAGRTETGFADCAAMMEEMDLIITSDTATAHIAGSLGVPTWTVLHWDAFWVWRHEGDTTQWYPGMRLFRQKTPLIWDGVMQEVQDALLTKMKEHV